MVIQRVKGLLLTAAGQLKGCHLDGGFTTRLPGLHDCGPHSLYGQLEAVRIISECRGGEYQHLDTSIPNGPARIPYEYSFRVAGREYRGTEFLSEQAVLWDFDTNSASAVVVYARANPAHHRMEPVTTIGGIRWVSVFPRVLLIAAGLSLTAWLAASWEHLGRLLKWSESTIQPAADAALVLLNTVAAVVFIVLPATTMAALLGWFEGNPFYVPHRGWLTVVAALALAVLLGTAWISQRVEAGEA